MAEGRVISQGFAKLIDMEPGQWFCNRIDRTPFEFVGVESVQSRFAGKRRVKVLTAQGVTFIVDRDARFPLVNWEGK